MSVVMNKPHRNVKWTGSVTAVRSVMMKWMYQCRGGVVELAPSE